MQLVGLSFQNYKAFRAREAIEIRPLTVLIGRNSSGKSAVARLPLLLAGALSDRAEAPLPLEGDGVDFGGSFVELIHNQQPHGAIEIGATFEDGGESFELRAKVQHYEEAKLPVVAELELRLPGQRKYTFEYLDKNPIYIPHHYRVSVEGHALVDLRVRFGGLRPYFSEAFKDPLPALPHDELLDVITLLSSMEESLSRMERSLSRTGYLGPFRPAPQRFYRDPGSLLQSVGRGGELAASLLGSDALRKGGAIVRAVGEWYKDHLGGRLLDVVWSGNTFSLVVRSPEKPDVAVNLVDVGAGLAQILPLIVQRHVESLTGKRGGLEIVEQPELHLHPGAHGDLADLYIEAAKHPNVRFLIETHSENFILRMRRRIAEGTLDPALVHLYWVNDEERPGSHIQRIEVSRTGDVSMWPKGVFSEDYEEFKAIRKAQKELEGAP